MTDRVTTDRVVAGLLLAGGAGRRMGGPKALLRDPDGVSFLDRALGTLLAGGCGTVTLVLGAGADAARTLLEETGWAGDIRVAVVHAADWAEGMGASLRAGLTALEGGAAAAALVSLVDLPDVDARVVRRVLDLTSGPRTLVRATYAGRPGHPVLIGRGHWSGVLSSAGGDEGARRYLDTHDLTLCECGDLASGRDLDRPEDLRA
jgi:CTP:molybdopterin cytidylyltransferase MocA